MGKKTILSLASATAITIGMLVLAVIVQPDSNRMNGPEAIGPEGAVRKIENRFPNRLVDPADLLSQNTDIEATWLRNESMARTGVVFSVWTVLMALQIFIHRKVSTSVAA